MRRLILAALAMVLPVRAVADPSAADKYLVDLAFQTCLAYPDNPKRLKFHLDATLSMAEHGQDGFFLGLNTGRVWLDHQPDANYAVVFFDTGRCVVEGDAVTVDGVMQAFAAHVESAKLPMKRTSDDVKGIFRGAPGHTQSYAWTYDGQPYRIGLAGTPLPNALLHAEISLEPPK